MTHYSNATVDVEFDYNIEGGEDNSNKLIALLEKAARLMKVSVPDMRGTSRKRDIVAARRLYCAAASYLFPFKPWSEIGTYILKDHATVLYHRDELMNKLNLRDEKSRHEAEMYRILTQEGI